MSMYQRTPHSSPTKSYVIDNDGNMILYTPEEALQLHHLKEINQQILEDDNSSNDFTAGDPAHSFAVIGSLDCAADFDDHLMQELDSDLMRAEHTYLGRSIRIHMDIQEPLTKLRELLEARLGLNLANYPIYLQGTHLLDPNQNLVGQCVQEEGFVQINVQVLANLKRIIIDDVLTAENYKDMGQSRSRNNVSSPNRLTAQKNTDKPAEAVAPEPEENVAGSSSAEKSPSVPNGVVLQWQVDSAFKKEQERLKIPQELADWTTAHVRHWIQWAVRQFNLPNIKLSDWAITGKDLLTMKQTEFNKIVPKDPVNVFWTHLEILRKTNNVAVAKEDSKQASPATAAPTPPPPPPPPATPRLMKQTRVVSRVLRNYASTVSYFDTGHSSSSSLGNNNHNDSRSPGNANNNNNNTSGGQIQLWQFLLELLTNREYISVIHWTGHKNDGEFKFVNPHAVAQLWGERKNKPAMNYEKLSRALRYYYEGDMIAKVQGERFVYKFKCDLKELLGYDSRELSNLVLFGRANYAGPGEGGSTDETTD